MRLDTALILPLAFGLVLGCAATNDDTPDGDIVGDGDGRDDEGDAAGGNAGDDDGRDDGDDAADDGDGTTHELLTVQGIYDYVREHDIDNVSDLLAALPPSMGGSFVLMESSRSRHLADLEHPRVIMYGLDSRFIMSAGGVPEDPLYEVIEMAEMDAETGLWIFRALDFDVDPPELGQSDASCQGCHGDPVRPIWGNYPDWPGAFGENENNLTGPQADSLATMLQTQDSTSRYHHLWLPDGSLYLPSRAYGYANTAFNFELTVAHADGLVTRMMKAEDWDTKKYDIVSEAWCGGERGKSLRALGLDGANDFQLHSPIFETGGDQYSEFGYNQGSTGLIDVVVFRVINAIARTDPEMAASLAAVEPTRTDWTEHWFDLRGDAREAWLQDFDLYAWDLRPQELLPAAAADMCAYLQSR
ncbi:MAG: hypothetical protein AAF721_02330 [Myxococcota bacterium]